MSECERIPQDNFQQRSQNPASAIKKEIRTYQVPNPPRSSEPDSSFQGRPHFTSLPATFPIVVLLSRPTLLSRPDPDLNTNSRSVISRDKMAWLGRLLKLPSLQAHVDHCRSSEAEQVLPSYRDKLSCASPRFAAKCARFLPLLPGGGWGARRDSVSREM
jgi:hypothetical protein